MAERAPLSFIDLADEINLAVSLVKCASLAAGSPLVPKHVRDPLQTVLDAATDRLQDVSSELMDHVRKPKKEPAEE